MTARTLPSPLRILALPFAAALAALPFACAQTTADAPGSSRAALGESPPPLGVAGTFGVLAGTTVTSTGPTRIVGDLGVSPGLAITGFPPGLVTGTTHAGDALALQAKSDLTAAYLFLAAEPCSANLSGTDLGGRTLTPGVYCFSSSAQLTGALTLDAQGRADAVFVFKTGSTLIAASGAQVRVVNGGSACGVYWQVGSSATVGTGATLAGSVLALTSITLATGASVSGRALARNGAVTLDGATVSAAGCGEADAGPVADATADGGTDARVDARVEDTGSGTVDAGVPTDAAADADADTVDACVDAAAPPEDAGAADACCDDAACG